MSESNSSTHSISCFLNIQVLFKNIFKLKREIRNSQTNILSYINICENHGNRFIRPNGSKHKNILIFRSFAKNSIDRISIAKCREKLPKPIIVIVIVIIVDIVNNNISLYLHYKNVNGLGNFFLCHIYSTFLDIYFTIVEKINAYNCAPRSYRNT